MSELDDFLEWNSATAPAKHVRRLKNLVALFRKHGKPPERRPEFAKRGLAGYVEATEPTSRQLGVIDARADAEAKAGWPRPDHVGVDLAAPGGDRTVFAASFSDETGNRRYFPLHGAADTARTEKSFAPELDALACEECARGLKDGEVRFCSDCV